MPWFFSLAGGLTHVSIHNRLLPNCEAAYAADLRVSPSVLTNYTGEPIGAHQMSINIYSILRAVLYITLPSLPT